MAILRFETDRLMLRKFESSDMEALHQLLKDEDKAAELSAASHFLAKFLSALRIIRAVQQPLPQSPHSSSPGPRRSRSGQIS